MVVQVVGEEDQLLQPPQLRPPVWLRLLLCVGVRACVLRELLGLGPHHQLLARALLGLVLVHSTALVCSSVQQRGQVLVWVGPDVASGEKLDVALDVGPGVELEAVFDSGTEPAAEGWLGLDLQLEPLQIAGVLTFSWVRDSGVHA